VLDKSEWSLRLSVMEVNPRTLIADEAETEIMQAVVAINSRLHITPSEWIGIFLKQASHWNKYSVRYERHGDYDTPGDLDE
jgi:hypothetical protein